MRGRTVVLVAILAAGCGTDAVGGPGTVPAVVTSPVTTSPVTTSPVTTGPVTTSPVTSSPPTTSPVTTSPVGPDGWDGTWTAVAGVVDGAPVELVGDITLEIEGTTFSGTSGCNSYELIAGIDGDTVTFLEGFSTEVGCDGPLMDMESAFSRSFGPVVTVTQDGTTLTVRSDTATWTFEWVPPIGDAPLAGTRWELEMLIDEFGATGFSDTGGAYLVIEEDGDVAGSTGCAAFGGVWYSVGVDGVGRVDLDVVVGADPCEGDLASVADAMERLLDDGFEPVITERSLRAMIDETTGIGFVAR